MHTLTANTEKSNNIKLRDKRELWQIFEMSANLADTIENFFESRAEYSKTFLKGLKKSLKEAEQGKTIRINSLKDLY